MDNATVTIGETGSDKSLSEKVGSFLPQRRPMDDSLSLKNLTRKAVLQNFTALACNLKNYPHLVETVVTDSFNALSFSRDCVRFIDHEGFWKKEVLNTFGEIDCDLNSNGVVSWKRFFLEKSLSLSSESDNELLSMASAMQDYIFTIGLRNSVTKPLMSIKGLPNLVSLHLEYRNKIGVLETTKESKSHFQGIQPSDIKYLATVLRSMHCCCSLSITNSQIDDDLLRIFVEELNRCEHNENVDHLHIRDTLIDLDLSHNKITTEGLRLITGCFLSSNSDTGNTEDDILATLKLVGNSIRAEGARTLGRILRTNKSLVTLDLCMNRLEDEGGKLLMDDIIHHNTSLKNLRLTHNSMSNSSIASFSQILENSNKCLNIDW